MVDQMLAFMAIAGTKVKIKSIQSYYTKLTTRMKNLATQMGESISRHRRTNTKVFLSLERNFLKMGIQL